MEQLQKAEEALKAARNDHESAYAAEIKKLDDVKTELLDRLHDLDEQKKQSAAAYGNANVSDDDLIEINSGGKIIAARRGVLCQLKGTRFEALFSGRWEQKLQRDGHGRIFLDVNPKAFRAIVDFLNELAISAEDEHPDSPCDGGDQLKYFGIYYYFSESNIIRKSSNVNTIHQWLKEDESEGDLKLIYRSSRDGLSHEIFHDKCDDRGRTLVVFETEQGFVLGGYSNTPWQSSGGYMTANKAFLFVLNGFSATCPIKMKLKDKNSHAIEANSNFGPVFGNAQASDDILMHASHFTLEGAGNAYEDVPLQMRDDGNYEIKEMEVFDVISEGDHHISSKKSPEVDRFTKEVNEAINEKWKSLHALEDEVTSMEESFKDEENFIEFLSSGNKKDIITLNVSGTMMTTNRATLMVAEDSVLAQQFDDTKWTEQGNSNSPKVKEWTSDDVTNWVKSIEGIPDSVASLFWENEINGFELLALDRDGLKDMGVKRVGTICLLLDEIKSLKEKVNQDVVTLIEHSPYCFGKILDHLRLKRLHSINLLAEEPALPTVCESQQKRFEKVVKYYFPGDSSSFILGPPLEP